MFSVGLLRRELPNELIDRYQLQGRITRRCEHSDEEVHFIDQHCVPLLPVWLDGQLRILPWGNRNSGIRLPTTLWCRLESLEEGTWGWLHPIEVIIPASYGCDRGVWYSIKEGLKGVVVKCGKRVVVYPIHQKSTHYYQVMTRSHTMPVFVGETI